MDFVVREARRTDKEPLMDFIKDVWGGHDYIPHVWDEWISDDSAKMYVVEVGGRAVALNRVRFLDDGSAWFEGVRVHPDYRGRGLATALGENAVKVAESRGVKTYRLTSSSWNKPAHRQIARMRFEEACRVSVYEAPKGARFSLQRGVRLASARDSQEVAKTVRESAEFRFGRGVAWESFAAYSLSPEILAKRIEEGSVYIADGAVAIVKPGREGKNVWNQVCFLCGDTGEAVKLAKHAFAAGGKADWKFAFVPQGSPIIHALRMSGFKRSFSLILFVKHAAKG